MKILFLSLLMTFSSFYYQEEVFTTADAEEVSTFYDADQTITKIDYAQYHQGIEFTKDLFLLKQNYNYHITKIMGNTDDSYYLIGSIDTGNYPFQSENLQEFPYLAYYADDELIWEEIFVDWGYGIINEALIDGDNIVVIGNYETAVQANMIVVAKFSLTGALKDKVLFSGNQNSYGRKIFKYQEKYFFVGTSFANDGDFYHRQPNNQNIVIGFVNNKNFQVKGITLAGNDGNNLLYDSVMRGNKIYLYMKFGGPGYFVNNNGETEFRALVSYDDRLEYQNHTPVGEEYSFKKSQLALANDSLAIISHDYWDNGLTFAYYEWDLDFVTKSKLRLSFDENKFYDYAIEIADYITICCNMKKDGVYHHQFIILTKDWQIVHQKARPSTYHDIPLSIYLINNIIYSGSETVVGGYQQPHLESHVNIKINPTSVALNGIYLSSRSLKDNYDDSMFGISYGLFEYKTGDYVFVIPSEKIIPVRLNIENKGTYDRGLTLDFNGLGYLNNAKINNGHVCGEDGSYLLELQGINQTFYYTFTIMKSSIDIKDIREKSKVNVELHQEIETVGETDKITINYNPPGEENSAYDIYVILILAVVGIIVGLVIPQRKKKNV